MVTINQLKQATEFLTERVKKTPKVGLILGSGLGTLADQIQEPVRISYDQIPGFPVSTVAGHAGQLVCGFLEWVPVVAMAGRFHYYECYGLDVVTFAVGVMKNLGVEKLFATNAAGGVNPYFQPGDLMLISDHFNNTGHIPLSRPNDA